MIKRANKLRAALDHFLDLEKLRYETLVAQRTEKPLSERPETSVTRVILQNRLHSDDWAVIKEIIALLGPFKDATKKLEGRPNENSASGFADVVPVLKILLENLETLKDQYAEYPPDRPVWVAIEQAWQKASHYYQLTDRSPAYAAAILLDPRQKFNYIEQEWGYSHATLALTSVRDLYRREYEPLPIPGHPFEPSLPEPLQEVSGNPRKRRRTKYRQLDEQLAEARKVQLPLLIQSELDDYLQEAAEFDPMLVPFQYWIKPTTRVRWPRLSRMAMDLFSIPAMSSEPERIFSLAGLRLSPRRSRLREDTVEASICLSNWGNSRLIDIGHHLQEKRGNRIASVDDDHDYLFERSPSLTDIFEQHPASSSKMGDENS